MNPPADFDGFNFAANALTGVDEYSVKYLKYQRGLRKQKQANDPRSDADEMKEISR